MLLSLFSFNTVNSNRVEILFVNKEEENGILSQRTRFCCVSNFDFFFQFNESLCGLFSEAKSFPFIIISKNITSTMYINKMKTYLYF